jgi:hypothetical protein
MTPTATQIAPLAGAAIALLVIARQFMRRRVRGWMLIGVPLLMLWGAYSTLKNTDPVATWDDAVFATVGLALAVVLGVLRGSFVRLWRDAEGQIWARGSAALLALWVASIGVRTGLAVAASYFGVPAAASAGESMLFAAATIGAQNVVMWVRAQPGAGAPTQRHLVTRV